MPSEILQVTATSTPNDWSLGAGADKVVAVNQPDDDDSSYIQPSSATKKQQYVLQNSSIGDTAENPTVVINSLTLFVRAKRSSGSDMMNAQFKIGSATSPQFLIIPGGGYDTWSVTHTTKPGGGAWTISDINSTEVILNNPRSSGSPGLTGSPLVTTVYVVVDYSMTQTPNDPDNLTISDIDSDFVELTWDDNSNVEDHFELQRSTDAGTTWTTIATLNPNVETYTDNNVASVTHYYYRIRAYNADASSGWSATVDDTTPAYSGPAETPLHPSTANLSNTSVDIHWEDGGATDSFQIQRSFDAGSTWVTIGTTPKEQTYYTDSGRLPGSSYQYKVRGVNTVGASSYTSAVTVVFPERSFRNFLQYEVLQDVTKYFDWVDRVKLPDQEFSVTQTFHASTNMTAEEMRRPDWGPWGVLRSISATFPAVNTVKISPALIGELPAGTVLLYGMTDTSNAAGPVPTFATTLAALPSSGAGKSFFKLMVAQNPAHIADDGTVLISGAAIGDTILYLKKIAVDRDTAATIGDEEPYLMRGWTTYTDPQKFFSLGNIMSRDITVTTNIDYSATPKDASPIYNAMTNSALLRLGYSEESEVPEEKYQQFRDAGRIAAWRAVVYSTVHLQDDTATVDIDVYGSIDLSKGLSQIHTMALYELGVSEDAYIARYETATPVDVVNIIKPQRLSSSNKVQVRF